MVNNSIKMELGISTFARRNTHVVRILFCSALLWFSFRPFCTCPITLSSHERRGVSKHRHLRSFSTFCLCAHQRKHRRSALLALCEGNPPVTGGFTSQRSSNAENVFISLRFQPSRFFYWRWNNQTVGPVPRRWFAACAHFDSIDATAEISLRWPLITLQ